MAVTVFNDVYRSGAASGSPVAAYYICDLYTEIGGPNAVGVAGDLAYAKDVRVIYLCQGPSSWDPIVTQNQGLALATGNLALKNGNPTYLSMEVTGTVSKTRVMNLGGELYITSNCYHNGTRWFVDNGSVYGNIVWLNANYTAFYRVDSAGTTFQTAKVDNVGNIVATNRFWELGRTSPIGEWIANPHNANNFTADGGATWTITNTNTNSYTLVGKKLTWTLFTLGTIVGTPTYLYIKLPAGLLVNGYANGNCNHVNISTGQYGVGTMQAQNALNYLTFERGFGGQLPFQAGQLYFAFTVSLPIQ
jgi:hypothetical protein